MMFKNWLFFSVFFFAAAEVRAAESPAYSPEWLALGHYRPQGNGRYESTIDSDNFFLAPDGKENPESELNATIALFGGQDEKRCFFPGRYRYLKKHNLTSADFPKCKEYEQFQKDLQPAGVTLLFTDAYMNNPSSLFGHTLLRIDTARKGTQLLAHGANYGAFTAGRENSVLFAVLGLTGGYYGGFTIKPYYDVINTYNNIENRDIWELNLDLTPEELDLFVAHLWEVGHAQSRYYFFTRNCSYMLMETLDAVRPELRLADDFPVQAIPLDTVKAVYSRPGLVKNINYRPSRQAKIKHRYKQMNAKGKEAYLAAIKNQDWTLFGVDDNAAKADILETAYQYVQYQYVARELELSDYRQRSFKALLARNKIAENGKMEELKNGKNPLFSHNAMRAVFGAGVRNGKAFQEFGYRPAYHSLTDDNYGFLRGAEINFLNTTFRHYDDSDKTVLQRFDLVGIKSLSPVDAMFKPVSYLINADVKREMNPGTEKEGYAFNLKVGGGSTVALNEEIWFYFLGSVYAGYGAILPDNTIGGLGWTAGIFADYGNWRLIAEAEKVLATNHFGDKMKYKAEAVYSLNRSNAVAAEYHYEQNYGKDLDEALISWRYYF